MKIHRINIRYQAFKILMITVIWIISMTLLFFNRNYGVDYVITGVSQINYFADSVDVLFFFIFGGVFLGISTGLFEVLFSLGRFGRHSHGVAIVFKTIFYFALIGIMVLLVYIGYNVILPAGHLDDTLKSFLTSPGSLPVYLYLIFTSFLINALIHIERILGPGQFLKIISGRYLQPKEEDRIFMFLDLNDSTSLAEKWGPQTMSSFLQDFFSDLSELILPYNGELYQFAGDEAIISWKLKRSKAENTACIKLFYAFQELISKKSNYYAEKYDHVPEFKAGLHCGPVIISEVGKYKVELAYHGDVLNTTARMTSQCRNFEKPMLVSQDLFDKLKLNERFGYENVGETQFRGKEKYINLFYIYLLDES